LDDNFFFVEWIQACLAHLHTDQHSISGGLIIFDSLGVEKAVKDTAKCINFIDRLDFCHFFVLIKLSLVLAADFAAN